MKGAAMTYPELFLAALALSMDAFAVALANGISNQKMRFSQILSIALCFGGFQGMMPTIGFFLGRTFASYITSISHILPLILLGYIGGGMISESRNAKPAASVPLTTSLLLMQGAASGIDALVAGVSFSGLPHMDILTASALLALFTFLFTAIGVGCGKKCSPYRGNQARLLGGMLLLGIGMKIFLSHLILQ